MIKVGYLNIEGLIFAKHQACHSHRQRAVRYPFPRRNLVHSFISLHATPILLPTNQICTPDQSRRPCTQRHLDNDLASSSFSRLLLESPRQCADRRCRLIHHCRRLYPFILVSLRDRKQHRFVSSLRSSPQKHQRTFP